MRMEQLQEVFSLLVDARLQEMTQPTVKREAETGTAPPDRSKGTGLAPHHRQPPQHNGRTTAGIFVQPGAQGTPPSCFRQLRSGSRRRRRALPTHHYGQRSWDARLETSLPSQSGRDEVAGERDMVLSEVVPGGRHRSPSTSRQTHGGPTACPTSDYATLHDTSLPCYHVFSYSLL